MRASGDLSLIHISEGLEPGEYKATLRVTVQEAFLPVLEIPVFLTVSDPAPVARIR